MLFYLTDSLIVSSNDPAYKNIYKAVRYIAEHVEDSQHLLTGDFDVIHHFAVVFGEDKILGPLFHSLEQNFALCAVPSYITYYIEIVSGTPNRKEDGNKVVCQVPYQEFLSMDASKATTLVGEDLNDGEFYKYILDWYVRHISVRAHCKLTYVQGGGVNTSRVVKQYNDEGYILVCIVDTDQKYPGMRQKEGCTYWNCQQLRIDKSTYCFLPLSVHEIENLFPLNFIDMFPIWKSGDDAKNKKAFDYLVRSNAESILPFFDYKKGITKDADFMRHENYQHYAELCYLANTELKESFPNFKSYIDSVDDNGCLYPPLLGGSGLLKRMLDIIHEPDCPSPELLGFQDDLWKKIGQTLLNWCVCRNLEQLY